MAADSRIPLPVNMPVPTVAPAVTHAPIPVTEKKAQNYKGFVAGVFSGIAKLTGELPSFFKVTLWRQQRARLRLHIGNRELASSSWSLLRTFV